jgi:hypothetical protein
MSLEINNTINITIPTMWREQNLVKYLESYSASKFVQKIIVIDNDQSRRPKHDIFNHEKIELVSYGRNIYVNPAWNEGYYRSNSDILCILNDDIFVEDQVFEFMSKLDFSEIDIIGVHLKGSIDNYHIVDHPDKKEELVKLEVNKRQPIGGQSYAFGVCLFIKRTSYRIIPSLYKIWYGDDYLIQRSKNIYALKTSKIKGEISKTIVAFDENSDVYRRIVLDSKNAFKFNHFLNGKNWNLVKQYSQKG